jgi:hypothetical protein
VIDASDLTFQFSTNDFAQKATFTVSGNAIEANGWLDEPTGDSGITDINVEAVMPTFTGMTTDLSGVTRGATMTTEGKTFTVVFVRSAGTGVSVCYLK